MNEVSNGLSGTNGEYVEFVVVSNTVTYSCNSTTPPCIDIRGWIFDDNSGYHGTSGIAGGAVRFSQNPLWSCIPLGTIILIYNKADKNVAIPADDLSMSDGNCRIIAPVDGALFDVNPTTPGAVACSYPATGWVPASVGTWSLSAALANGGDCARIVNLSGCEVFSVCYGSDNLNTQIYFTGNGGQKVYYFNDTDPTNQANWIGGDASANPGDQTPGMPNNAANAAYIAQFNNGCMPITSLSVTATSVNAGCGCTGSATASASGSIGGYTYVWYDALFNPIGQTSATANGLCAGVYNVIATSHIGCTDTTSVTIASSSTISVAANSQTVCLGNNAVLTASSSVSGGTYLWSPGGQTTSSISVNPLSNTTYSVVYSLAGCSASGSASVIIKPSPTVTVNSQTICNGQAANIVANGASTYSWNTGAISNSIFVSPNNATTYTVVGTTGGCTNTAIATVSVNAVPTVTVNTATICNGQTVNLIANGASTYTWSTGVISNSISVSPSSTTNYSVLGSISGCTNVAVTSVSVNPLPIVSVNSATICSGQTTTLIANGASSYNWSNASSSSSIIVSPTSNTIYTLTGTTLGCSQTVTTEVVVNTSLLLTVNTPTICAGQTAVITANGASTYTWSNGTNSNMLTISPISNTSYSVIGKSGLCTGTTVANVIVNSVPNVTVNSGTICSGQSINLLANGATSYTWSSGATINPLLVTPTVTSSYSIIGSTAGCTNTAVVKITVNPLPILSVNSPTVCSGQSTTLTATGASLYVWNTGSALNPLVISPSISSTYSVIGTALGCTNIAVSLVTVISKPNVSVNSSTICTGQTATLIATGASSYTWSNGSINNPLILNPSSSEVYTVTGFNGNCSDTKTVSVVVSNKPVVNFNSDKIIGCSPLCINFSDLSSVSSANIQSWNWSFESGKSSASQNPSYCFTKPGLYDITLSVTSSNGCSNSLTINKMINVLVTPTAQFISDPPETNIIDPTIHFFNQSTNAVSYQWNFGDSNNSTSTNPIHEYSNEGVYTVTLVATSQDGCKNKAIGFVKIDGLFTFYAPNAFSPNNDSKNDVFIPLGTGWDSTSYKLYIHDRWGNMCFETNDPNIGWDGKANHGSGIAQIDTYTWTVELKDVYGKIHNYIGRVTIIK